MHPTGIGLSCSISQPILELFPALRCKGKPPAPSSILGTAGRARSCGGSEELRRRAGTAPGSPSPSSQAAAMPVSAVPLFPRSLPFQAQLLQAAPGGGDPNIPRG